MPEKDDNESLKGPGRRGPGHPTEFSLGLVSRSDRVGPGNPDPSYFFESLMSRQACKILSKPRMFYLTLICVAYGTSVKMS